MSARRRSESGRRGLRPGLRRLASLGIETLSAKELFYDWVRTIERADAFHRAEPGLAVPPGVRL